MSKCTLFQKQDVKLLFSNLDEIVKFSARFSGDLERAMSTDKFGTAFLDVMEDISRVYAEFCKGNEAAIIRAGELLNGDVEVAQFLKVPLLCLIWVIYSVVLS